MTEVDRSSTEVSTGEAARAAEPESIFALLLWLWRDRWLVIGVGATVLILTLAVSLLVEKKYRASVLVAPVESQQSLNLSSLVGGSLGGLASMAGLAGGASVDTDKALALLTSRGFTTDFIAEEGLRPILFAKDWDATSGEWRDGEAPTLQDAFKKFHREIRSVSVDRKTGLVTLSILWSDPDLSSEWAFKLIDRANEQLRQQAIREARQNIEFLEKELENTAIIDLRSSIFDLISSNIQQTMLASTRREYAFEIIDPPVPADVDKFVTPNYLLFALLGMVLGGAAACLVVFLRNAPGGWRAA